MEPGRHPRYHIHGLEGQDTTILGHTFHKLFRYFNDPPDPLDAVCVGAIRESADKKIWFRNFSEQYYPVPDTGEVMLYDFGVQPGDTIRNGLFTGTEYLVVSGFDAVEINGALRKRILFNDFVYSGWIMGMGSERGLLFPSGDLPSNGMWGDLVCFYQDGEEIFRNEGYENCYEPPAGTEDLKAGFSGISVRPNPCSDYTVNIEAVEPMSKIILVDTSGRILRVIFPQGRNSVRLPVSSLVRGLYLLRATCRGGRAYSARLVLSR